MNKPQLKKSKKLARRRTRQDIVDQKTHEIANRFNAYKRKTAENIIEMGRIVIEAKNRSKSEFEDFCLLIGYDWASSTIRKLESIGSKYEYLISQSDNLPPSWTVIYDISRLNEDVIEKYIESNDICANSTGSSITKLLTQNGLKTTPKQKVLSNSNTNVPNRTFSSIEFTASAIKIGCEDLLYELKLVFNQLDAIGFHLTFSEKMKEIINELETLEMES